MAPRAPAPVVVAALALLALLPVGSSRLHGDGLRDLGFRRDNLARAAREAGLATASLAVVVLVLSALSRNGLHLRPGIALALAGYPFWGLAQQYMLQGFAYRRLRAGLGSARAAALVAALLFGAVHFPNPALLVSTALAGYVWCRLYEREPNLYALALSHALLAALLLAALPRGWLHTLRVGPGYWLHL